MPDLIEQLIANVIEREQGYVDHPNDHGGATNWGITQATLSAWRGRAVTKEEVRALTPAEAAQIYRGRYFEGLDGIKDPAVLELMFDYAVNSGSNGAKRGLQRVLKSLSLYRGRVDGIFGEQSQAALAQVQNQATLYFPLLCERLSNFLYIIGNDPSQAVFATGWANRLQPFWNGVR